MNSKNYKEDALVMKAFSDENRLKIIEQIRDREVCACCILKGLTISQSTLSHHMKILIECGIINARKNGKWTHYSLSEEGIRKARAIIDDFTKFGEEEIEKSGCLMNTAHSKNSLCKR